VAEVAKSLESSDAGNWYPGGLLEGYIPGLHKSILLACDDVLRKGA